MTRVPLRLVWMGELAWLLREALDRILAFTPWRLR